MMKKRTGITALILCLLLALPALAAPLGAGQELSARLQEPMGEIQSMAWHEGCLWLTDARRLHLLDQEGHAQGELLDSLMGPVPPDNFRQVLLLPGEELALIDRRSGLYLPLRLEGGKPAAGDPVQLDWADFIIQHDGYQEVKAPAQLARAGGTLYGLMGPGEPLQRFDLKTGQALPPLSQSALLLLPYKAGQLMLVQEEGEPAQRVIQRYDPEVDSLEPLSPVLPEEAPTKLFGGSYEPSSDSLYLAMEDGVRRYQGGKAGELCASLPYADYRPELLAVAALPGDLLAIANGRQAYLMNSTPEDYAGRRTLRLLLGADYAPGLNEAQGQLPDIRVELSRASLDALTLAQLLISGDDQHDLYWVKLSQVDFQSLMKKGYALDLSGSAALQQNHAALYPFLQQAVGDGKGIHALPLSAHVTVLLGEQGFVFDDQGQPRLHSLQDFLQYLSDWPERYGESEPGMLPYRGYEVRPGVYQLVLEAYAGSMLADGEPLSFDTPLFRGLMGQAEKLPWDAISGQDEDYYAPAIFDQELLHFLRQFNGDGRDSHHYLPFLLSAGEGKPAAMPLDVSALFINPRTREPEAALRLMEALLTQIQPDARAMLSPEANEPVENPLYPQQLQEQQRHIDQVQAALKKAGETERAELKARLDRLQAYLTQIEQQQRYLISEQNLTDYRALAQGAYLLQQNGEQQGLHAARKLLPQYAEGQISLEQFITEAEARLKLIRTENQ